MKIMIEVPDSELMPSVQDMIKKSSPSGEEKRAIVYACLTLAMEDFHVSRITIDGYKLVVI